MKMRKKIAALLAAAMIASVMPMTAFAASTNRVSQIVKVANDGSTKAPQLKIRLNDNLDGGAKGKTFYVKLENAKWGKEEAIQGATYAAVAIGNKETKIDGDGRFEVERLGDTELAVTVKAGEVIEVDELIVITLDTTSIKGEATVTVEPWDTTVSKTTHTFATSSDKKATVSVGDAPSFYIGKNYLAKITLEENALGAFGSAKNQVRDSDKKITTHGDNIEITLDNDDFEFTGVFKVAAKKGFSSLTVDNLKDALDFNAITTDAQRFVIEMKINSFFKDLQRGVIELELEVRHTTKNPTLGDLEAEISGDLVEAKDYKVAKIAEYGVELKSEKEYEFVAGQIEKVEFHLNEIVADSMVEGRYTDFFLPAGVHFKHGSVKIVGGSDTAKEYVIAAGDYYHDGDDDMINGFTAKLPVKMADIDKFKFEAEIEITSAFEGDIVLKAEGRSIGENLEVKLAEVEAPVKVTVEPMKVKPGFKEQAGGKIVIEETDKARLMQYGEVVITLEKESGMTFTGKGDLKVVAGDLRTADFDLKTEGDGQKLVLKVKRRSKEASKIEISNVEVKLNRSVPQGFYDVNVGGSAISKLANTEYVSKVDGTTKTFRKYGNDNIKSDEFLIVGDPITGVKSEVKFVIGSNKFLVDGVEKTMDAAAYIKDGRTMVPLRYLATALGIDEEAIKFNSGIVTIFVGDGKVIQVEVNSKDLVINGMTIPMVAAAEIIEGRTYVPVTEIGGVFGVAGNWDSATQTATFK